MIVAASLVTLAMTPVSAQTSEPEDLEHQVEKLRAENAALKKEVAELRATLSRLMTPPPSVPGGAPAAEISIAGLPVRGSADAPVTIVEFSDYQSERSARFFEETYPRIEEDFVRPGKVRYVFKNFPDLTAHPQVLEAHEAAACAGDQGRYWEMHDLLLADQAAQGSDDLVAHARTLGLDTDVFRYCLTSGAHAAVIRRDVDEGQKGGVPLTPVFAIGLTEPGAESIKVMRVVAGPQPFAVFEDAIGAVLASSENVR